MSDRLAVFNRGRIEQVGPPAEVYERPANEFVAGFVGVSNVLERDGPPLHGPARRSCASSRAATSPACTSSRAASATSPTPGWSPATSSTLDAGGELQVVRQNLETSSAEALAQRGREVRIGWREEHTYAIEDEGGVMRKGPWTVVFAIAAVLSLGVVACGGDDVAELVEERRGEGPEGAEGARLARRGRGQAEPDRLGRLRRGRLDRPEGRLGVGLREADRLPGQRQGRQHLRRDGHADAHGPVRRRVGLG